MRTLAVFFMFAVIAPVTGLSPLHADETNEPLGQLIESFADLARLEYSNSPGPALKDLQNWHQTTPKQSVRVSWMMYPTVHTQDRAMIRLSDGMRSAHHYVYRWAVQGGFSSYLRPERITAIQKTLADIPKGMESVTDTKDLVIISFRREGVVRQFAYRRTDLPAAVMRLCLLGDIDIDIAPAEKKPHIWISNPVW